MGENKGNVVASLVSQFVRSGPEWYNIKKQIEHTYILIFGPEQESLKKFFLDNFKGDLLFVSNKALNSNYPDSGPRNTVVIFELLSEEAPYGPPGAVKANDEQVTI